MTRHTLEGVVYAPFYLHSFPLVLPHTLVEAEKFNLRYTDPSQIETTADKLRWYRYRNGLLQRDVADYAGIDRSTYSGYEEVGRDYYPIEQMKRIAELYAISVTALLDEYNTFLYHGQGHQIKTLRQSKGMTQSAFSEHLGMPIGTLKGWEQGKAQISKATWSRLFKEPCSVH